MGGRLLDNTHIFANAANTTEYARIDSSGNLLVGTTSTTPAVSNDSDGIALQANGTVQFSANATTTAIINRKSTDGPILQFRKDGSIVGSIGVDNTDNLTISGNSSHCGLNFSTDDVNPYKNGAYTNGTTSLGTPSTRFKDLYLSGGVYLGGTGSANKLEDYEEGTWTPNIDYGGTDGTMSSASGVYTKVGRIVHCSGMLVVSSTNGGTGNAFLTGLPFTVGDLVSSTGVEASGVISYFASMGESVGTMSIAAINGQTYCEIYKGTSGTGAATANHTTFAATAQIRFSISYATT